MIFCLSFVLSLLLVPVARALAIHVGLVDRPDGRRKLHVRPIPVAGGPPLLAAVGLTLLVVLLWRTSPENLPDGIAPNLVGLSVAAVLICLVGLADDLGRLRGRQKLFGQLAVVAIVIVSGVEVRTVHLLGWQVDLGTLAVPFTAFILLGAINSLNLLDGMDGHLASVACIICVALGATAVIVGQEGAACVAFAMAGALLGFLGFNFPPASIFLGDSGSMLIGLVVGVLAIQSSLKGPATVALATPMALLVLPIFDTSAAILRRKLTGRSLYSTDRGHLHHCLLRRLPGPRYVLLVVSACCLVLVGGAFAGLLLGNDLIALITALMVVAVLCATRLFGYAEILLVKKRFSLLVLSFFQTRGEGRFRRIDVRLHGTINWRALLDGVAQRAFELNLHAVRLDVSVPALHEDYHAQWDCFQEEREERLWRLEVPLTFGARHMGTLTVSGYPDAVPLSAKLAELLQLIDSLAQACDPLWQAEPAVAGQRDPELEDAPPVAALGRDNEPASFSIIAPYAPESP